MLLQRRLEQLVVHRLLLEDLIARDELPFHLLDLDHVAELHRLVRLAADEQLRVGLEDTEDLLLIGDLLVVENPPPRLIEDAFAQTAVVKQIVQGALQQCLFHRPIRPRGDPRAEGRCDRTGPMQDVLNEAKELRIQPFQAGLGPSLLRCLAGDLLGEPLGLADQEPSLADNAGVDRPDLFDRSRQGTVGVPQQRGIGRPVDVGFHRRCIQPELPAIDLLFVDGRPGQQRVGGTPGLGLDAVPELAEGGVVDHGPVVDADKGAQIVAVINADDNLPQRAFLDDLTQRQAQDRV